MFLALFFVTFLTSSIARPVTDLWKSQKANGDEKDNAICSNIIYPISSAHTTCAAHQDHLVCGTLAPFSGQLMFHHCDCGLWFYSNKGVISLYLHCNFVQNVCCMSIIWSCTKVVALMVEVTCQNVLDNYFALYKVLRLKVWVLPRKTASVLTLRRLMSYIYGAPILDVSRSHTTTQHSR